MVAALGLGVAFSLGQIMGLTPPAFDALAYWSARPGELYADGFYFSGHQYAAFVYTPAFADVLVPFRLLPERLFSGLWQMLLFGAMVITIRGWALPVLALSLTGTLAGNVWLAIPLADIAMGNIHWLLGAVAVFGLRYPALWAFAVLSKVTPGVGLVWFLARKEWRNLTIAIGVTGAIALGSFAYSPRDWVAFADFLVLATRVEFPLFVLPVPLWLRVPLCGLLIVWAARTERRWVVPVAVGFSIPLPYTTLAATMLCALAYVRPGARE